MREIDFLDGFTSSAEPVIGDLKATGLKCYASDILYIAGKENPVAECGDVYFNTTLDAIRTYDGADWHTCADLETAQTFLDEITFDDIVYVKAGLGVDTSAAGVLKLGETNANEVQVSKVGVTTRVMGDLRVEGTTTQVQTATLEVEDKNIEVNKGGDDVSAEGAGLTVDRTGTDGSLIYAAAATSKFLVGPLGSEKEIATISDAQILTNKTFDADSNTLTNIDDGNVKVGAAISRSKLASGTADHVLINDGSGVMSSEAVLDESRGGTGNASYATGDILVAAAASVLGRLPIGANGMVLKMVAGVPAWDLEAAVTGTGFNVDSIVTSEITGTVVINDAGNVVTDNTNVPPGSALGQILKKVYNNTGSPIAQYKVVAWLDDGSVTLADADSVSSIQDIAGITTEAIADGSFGLVNKGGLMPGVLAGLGATAGQDIYLSSTPGGFSKDPSTDPGIAPGDNWIRLGYAEPADETYSPTSEDLFMNLEFVASY